MQGAAGPVQGRAGARGAFPEAGGAGTRRAGTAVGHVCPILGGP